MITAATRQEFVDVEGLGDVVVAAVGEPGDALGVGVLGGEEDDAQPGQLPAQDAADLEAVAVGQHDVEDDEVGPAQARGLDRLGGGGGRGRGEAVEVQHGGHHVDDVGFVVHDEDSGSGGHRASRESESDEKEMRTGPAGVPRGGNLGDGRGVAPVQECASGGAWRGAPRALSARTALGRGGLGGRWSVLVSVVGVVTGAARTAGGWGSGHPPGGGRLVW
ncbi:hypothetical protein HNR12_001564 [Streptomonospora nanhaiensis]|uniref:Uncharacterized protein n=1 Tax=Streptomonospora nanhaiensis TaxID=1323731 RepID=A0A853BKV8_9ACTN|nr:hypothetical protein [Streptomonospora nanhaiensis]